MKLKKFFKTLIGIYSLFFLIFEYREVNTAVISCLKLWAKILIPALFPYLVLSQYIVGNGLLGFLSPALKFISAISGVGIESATVCLSSLFCGFPSSALITQRLYSQNLIGREEAEKLVCFTNNASPVFLISAVGGAMLRSVPMGIALYVIQWISAFLWASVSKNPMRKHTNKSITCFKKISFSDCCEKSIGVMLSVCAYLILANIGSMIVISPLGYWVQSEKIKKLAELTAYSLSELTNAMKTLSGATDKNRIFPLLCFFVSWSGICAIMQVKSVLPKDFKIRGLIFAKFAQGILSFFAGIIYVNLFESKITFAKGRFPVYFSLGFSLVIFLKFIIKSIKEKAVCKNRKQLS